MTAVVLACAAVLVQPTSAVADDGVSGGGWIDEGTPTAGAAVNATSGGSSDRGIGTDDRGGGSSGSGAGGDGPRCVYERVPDDERLIEPDGSERVKPGPGVWYVERCFGPDGLGEVSWNVVFAPEGTAPGQQVDPLVLAQRALRQLPLASPAVGTSPPADRDQLVNLATWLWVDEAWEPLSASASVPGVTVMVTATPTSVRWDMGTGETVTCDGPGQRYDPRQREEEQSTDCSYTTAGPRPTSRISGSRSP